jgi:hypothetical protein
VVYSGVLCMLFVRVNGFVCVAELRLIFFLSGHMDSVLHVCADCRSLLLSSHLCCVYVCLEMHTLAHGDMSLCARGGDVRDLDCSVSLSLNSAMVLRVPTVLVSLCCLSGS